MALVADIQLQNSSIVPEKLDTSQYFTAAGLTASNYLAAGEGVPITTSGLTTFITANDLQSWFTSNKTDGKSSIILNNDSNQRWAFRLDGTDSDKLILDGGISVTIPYLAVTVDGNFGLGTNNPSTNSILDAQANNSTSAVIQLANTTDGTTIKLHADSSVATIGTSSNNNVGIKVNDTTIATLSSGGMDLGLGYQYTIAGQPALGGALETQKGWINSEDTNFNASKISFIDMGDNRFVWDWEYAKKNIRQTSWYVEGGLNPPPRYGMLTIDEAQDSLIWINRDDASLSYTNYMTFNMGTNNIIDGTPVTHLITDYSFLDFKLYIATSNNGLIVVDFLEDKAYRYTSTTLQLYNGSISDRNNGNGWISISNDMVISNNLINSISVMRDPLGSEDGYFRPSHYWAVATNNGLSTYSSLQSTIYEDNNGTTDPAIDVKTLEDGSMWWVKSEATEDKIYYLEDITTLVGDNYSTHSFSPSDIDGQQLISVGSDVISSIDAYQQGNLNGGLSIFIFDQAKGVHFVHNNKTDVTDSAHFYVTSTYSTPYMKGGRVAGWPLDSVTDRSGNSNDLTNNNTITFSTSDAPFGNKAILNGTNQYFDITTSNFSFDVNSSYFSGWVKTSSTTNPGVGEKQYIIHAWNSVGVDNNYEIYFDENGYINLSIQDDAGSSYTVTTSYDLYDNNWHHIVAQRNSVDDVIELWVDGILIGATAFPNTAINNTTNIQIGLDQAQTATSYFAGELSNIAISNDTFLSKKEIKYEFNRGNISISQATIKLESDTVNSINVDVDSAYIIALAGNKVNLMDLLSGVVYEKDSIVNGSLNDADIRTMGGSYTPHYLMGGTLSIQQQAANTVVD